MKTLTQDDVINLFDYNPNTGDFTWRVTRSNRVKKGGKVGCVTKEGYLRTSLNGKHYLVHRLIWLWVFGKWPENDIDHKNRNRSDNRLNNLRDVSRKVNLHNSDGAGFYFNPKRQKFVSQIRGEIHTTIGYFDTALDARAAYLRKKGELGLHV